MSDPTSWFKCSVNLLNSPGAHALADLASTRLRAGQAMIVYLAILGVNAEHGCDGCLSRKHASPRLLAGRAAFAELDDEEIKAALDVLSKAGLLEQTGSSIKVVGWSDAWRVRSPAARMRRYRSKKPEKKK